MMSRSGAVTLGDIATMLEVACSRCERLGRLSVAKLIERHAQLTRTVLASDCPRIGGAIYEQCRVHYLQLVRLWRGEPPA
jgi:hypothetical protein